jgi:glucokinase
LIDWAVGIDLGGTNIRVAKVDIVGKICNETLVEIDRNNVGEVQFSQIISLVEKVINANDGNPPLGIGIGVTGPIDVETGIIDNPFTLPPHFQGNIKKVMADRFNVEVKVENDANAACIGEAYFGAGGGAKVVACLTVGTGIGAGVINNGIVYRGANGIHPEAGHMHIDKLGPLCYCGKYGCLEALASGTALRDIGVSRGVLTAEQSGKDLVALSEKGNKDASQIIEEANQALGYGVLNLISTYGPEKLVLTGGAFTRSEKLLKDLQKSADVSSEFTNLKTEIKFGVLGDWAGTIGAASCIIRGL